MDIDSYVAYTVIAVGYIASPGPAVFLAINGGASIGIKNTALILFGNTIGIGVIAFISALGLGELILNSSLLTAIVKTAGACWLVYMGIKMMKSDFSDQSETLSVCPSKKKNVFALFYDGLMLALTNPKPIIFFVSIYPQFVITNGQEYQQLFFLGGMFMALSFVLLNCYSFISNITVGKVLSRNRARLFNFSFGSLFILLALFLITELIIGHE